MTRVAKSKTKKQKKVESSDEEFDEKDFKEFKNDDESDDEVQSTVEEPTTPEVPIQENLIVLGKFALKLSDLRSGNLIMLTATGKSRVKRFPIFPMSPNFKIIMLDLLLHKNLDMKKVSALCEVERELLDRLVHFGNYKLGDLDLYSYKTVMDTKSQALMEEYHALHRKLENDEITVKEMKRLYNISFTLQYHGRLSSYKWAKLERLLTYLISEYSENIDDGNDSEDVGFLDKKNLVLEKIASKSVMKK